MEKIILLLGTAVFFSCIFCSGTRPSNLGIKDGKLSNCPGSPNCVSSYADINDKEHYIEPLSYSGEGSDAFGRLIKTIKSMKRAEIIKSTENYIYAEFTSAIFRFVDDVEFYLDESKKVIQVRSASRIGHSDLGVNRKRVESVRTLLSKNNFK